MDLRIGVIGCGAIGTKHMQRINDRIDGAKVVAVNDIKPERAAAAAKLTGAKIFDDGNKLVTSPDVDAIVVTTNDPAHKGYVLKAIAAKKYVFCEKPLALGGPDCMEIVNAEVDYGQRLVQVGFMRHFDRGYEEIKAELDKGYLGEPLMVHCTHRNEEVDESYDTPMAVENTAVHEIDILRWLLGENFVSTEVILPRKQTSLTHANLHDPQFIILETESGINVDIEVFVNCQFGYDINCKVVCEKGQAALTSPTFSSIKYQEKDYTHIPAEWEERFVKAYDREFQLWVKAVKADHLTGPSAWDGYMASVTTGMCSKARESGKREKIMFNEMPALYAQK